MNPLWLYDTCGFIVGPAILATGLAALLLCAWLTFSSTSRRPRRLALTVAALPTVLGVCGFLAGLVVVWNEHLPSVPWLLLGKVCLAGAVTSVVPLIWALLLVRGRKDSGSQVASS